jgi:hypothetical protein
LARAASIRIGTIPPGCSYVPESLSRLERPVVRKEILPDLSIARASVQTIQAQSHDALVLAVSADDGQPVADLRPAQLVGLYPTVCFREYGRDGSDPRRFALVAVPRRDGLFRSHLEDVDPFRRPWRAASRYRTQSEADRFSFRKS